MVLCVVVIIRLVDTVVAVVTVELVATTDVALIVILYTMCTYVRYMIITQ